MRTFISIVVPLVLALGLSAFAVPPTDEAVQIWKEKGIYDQKIARWQAFKAAGGDAPNPHKLIPAMHSKRSAATAQGAAVDTFHVLAILVDFTDHPSAGGGVAGTPFKFDSLLFSDRTVDPVYNTSGSMTEYYLENSCGSFYIEGDVTPTWYRMALPYSHYSENDGFDYSYELARNAVIAADPDVDYTKYDNDGDGYVDGVIIIHAGPGAEEGVDAIWSHVSGMGYSGVHDGKQFEMYSMCPEEYREGLSNIGVYGHEYGHILSLPDLYDIDKEPATSKGLGAWSMMAGGSWNASGRHPAHFDAWCKYQLGFVTPIWVTTNLQNVAFPAVEYNPVVYRLVSQQGGHPPEYWLVENRQRVGFDASLPGEGLLIYHIDDSQWGNIDHTRYAVALEQADGLNELALSGSQGDGADPFPGSTNNREFHDLSSPNSRYYVTDASSEVGVWQISDSDSIMYADLDVTYSRPYITLRSHADSVRLIEAPGFSDGDGIYEAGENIDVYVELRNQMLEAYNWYVELVADNPNVQYTANDVRQNSTLNPTLPYVSSDVPVKISLPTDFVADIVTFEIIIRADSVNSPGGPGDRIFADTLAYRVTLGHPRVLVVDDDNASLHGSDAYVDAFNRVRLAHGVWNKSALGSPSPSILSGYRTVFWCTGDPASGGILSMADVTAMEQYLDQGGNLAIASFTAGRQLNALAPSFLPTYMKVQWTDVADRVPFIKGYTSNVLAPDARFRLEGVTPAWIDGLSDPVDQGQAAFFATNSLGTVNNGNIGVTYVGSYRTVFLGFPLEWVSASYDNYLPPDTLFARLMWFFEESEPPARYAGVVGENSMHVVSDNPTFWWSYYSGRPVEQDQLEFEVGSDTSWSIAELWSPGLMTTVDTTLVYAGTPLLGGVRYYYRLRTHDTEGWSEWTTFSFRTNTGPSVPTIVSPANGSTASEPLSLKVTIPADPEGDMLTASFELYGDAEMTQLIASSSGVTPQSPSSFSWMPSPQPPEEVQYWWRSRANDGYEQSGWTALTPFLFDSPSAPEIFALVAPEVDTLPLFDLPPTFVWHRSNDADLNDTVTYTLDVSSTSDFGTIVWNQESLDTLIGPVLSLEFGAHYFWRVTATDKSALFFQTPTAEFWTWLPGDLDHSHGRDIGDLNMLVDFLFFSGVVTPEWLVDVSADCAVDLSDLQWYVDFLFFSGPEPAVSCIPR